MLDTLSVTDDDQRHGRPPEFPPWYMCCNIELVRESGVGVDLATRRGSQSLSWHFPLPLHYPACLGSLSHGIHIVA